MAKQASVLTQMGSIVGREGALADVAAFAVDGLTPQAAVAPSSYEQVAAVMRYAHAEGLAVIPWGGGAHIHVGNVPARYDIALGLSRLNAVVEHEPADLTATVQAGMTLSELQGRLGGAGQLLPLDPPGGERATIGGILAANASGPWRHAFGSARDMTIGLRVVTAEGRITRAGGRVVKNVAGYDLCKLYIGSLGTLGVIVEATFKVASLPREQRAAVATFATAA
ncbi:MAG: linked oxidase-like protein, partial [Dehalococcoidia bacterium]|nr:linked oxidase-like protein [Dehalococcoidia bacterium]